MSSVPTGGNTLKNVTIGIVTTVAAYLIVHMLLDKKPDNEEFKRIKKATVEAFNSINNFYAIANEKFSMLDCTCDKMQLKNEIIRNLDMLNNNYSKISENKDVDVNMRSIIDIYRQQYESEKPIYQNYFDSLAIISNYPEADQVKLKNDLRTNFQNTLNYVQTRDSSDLNKNFELVNNKYKLKLALRNADPPFDTTALAGKWNIQCIYYLDFKTNGSVVFSTKDTSIAGKWNREDADIYLNLDDGEKLHYIIESISHKLLTIRLDGSSNSNVACPVD
jgi:hypothetical protein